MMDFSVFAFVIICIISGIFATMTPIKLDLSAFRNSRQFSSSANAETDFVAVGLIDALQKWADALETQISLTHGEVLTLRSESRSTTEEINQLKSENVRRDKELARLRMDIEEDVKASGKKNNESVQVLTKSLKTFVDGSSVQIKSLLINSSILSKQMNSTRSDLIALSNSNEYLKKRLSLFTSDYRTISKKITKHGSSIERLNRSSLSLDSFSSTLVNLTNTVYNDIASIKDSTVSNFTTLAVEMNALKMGFRSSIFNATNSLDKRIALLSAQSGEFNSTLGRIEREQQDHRSKFVRLEGKYGDLKDRTSEYEVQISKHVQVRNNFTNHVLRALEDFGKHLSESRDDFRRYVPDLARLNSTLLNAVGNVKSRLKDSRLTMNTQLEDLRRVVFVNARGIEWLNKSLEVNSREMSHQLSTLNFMQGNKIGNKKKLSLGEIMYEFHSEVILNNTLLRSNLSSMQSHMSKIESSAHSDGHKLTSLAKNLGNFEEYYINLKRQIFQNRLYIVNFNVSLHDLGNLGSDLRDATEMVNSKSDRLLSDFKKLKEDGQFLHSQLYSVKNDSVLLRFDLVKISDNVSELSGNLKNLEYETRLTFKNSREDLNYLRNKTHDCETRIGTLLNHSLTMRSSLLSLKKEYNDSVYVQNSLQSSMNNKVSKLYEIYSSQTEEVANKIHQTRGNMTLLNESFGQGLTSLETKLELFKKVLYNTVDNTDVLESKIESIEEKSLPHLRKELDSLQIRIRSTHSDSESNMLTLKKSVDNVANSITLIRSDVANVTSALDVRMIEVEHRFNGFTGEKMSTYNKQLAEFQSDFRNMSHHVHHLDNLSNEMGHNYEKIKMVLESYLKETSTQISGVMNNVSVMGIDVTSLRKLTLELESQVKSLAYTDKDFRGDFTKLSTEVLSLKNLNFDAESGIVSLKESSEAVTRTLENIDDSVKRHELVQANQDKSISDLRSDMVSLRAAMTSLTNTIFILKARFANDASSGSNTLQSIAEGFGTTISKMTNLSALSRDVLQVKSDLANVQRRDISDVKSDVSNLKKVINSLVTQLDSVLDPSRFSCSVTSDEIRTAGVITYSVCDVNSKDMMNRDNGHVTVKVAGDYLLSFTANMVSVNSQVIWCALYKQSPGSDGWQVLGMINNYQKDAATEDDRDSASLTILAGLEDGDQVWVEWRGYGESFLYSNPYRLINFMGLLVKKRN